MRETRAYINRKTREKEKKRKEGAREGGIGRLSLIHISEPTRPY